jgi:hypothetical protein
MRSQEASLHDVRILSREIKRRCAEHDITVRYADGLDTAYSTPDSIVLPAMNMPITREQMHLIRYYMIHEVGHHLRSKSFDLLVEAAITNKNAHGVWNMLEDEQLERNAQSLYFGDRKSLCIGRNLHITDMLNRWAHDSKGGTLQPSEDTAKAVAAHAVCNASREWHPQVEHLVENMLETCGPLVREWYTTLMDEGWCERIATPLDEEQTRDLAMELFARLWPEQEAGKAPEDQPSEGEEGEGEGGEQSETQQNGDENPEENQGDAEGKGEKRSKNEPSSQEHGKVKEFTIPWDEIVGSEHGVDPETTSTMDIDYTGWHRGEVKCYPDERIETVDVDDSRPPWRPGRERQLAYNPDTTFANQMRRHIQSEARDTWETNRKTGRLNVRAIKRIKTGTKEHNRRIFKRRTDHEAINTCITVLVDWSGSMFGGRDAIAAGAAGLLVDSFERVLRVPVEVLAHTTGYKGLKMIEVKPYGDRSDGRTVVKRLAQHDLCGNADGDALLYAWDRIKARPEKRKIIISIADGQPADCYDYTTDAGSVLSFAIEEIRKSKVELYGIGAQHREIKDWYGDDSEVVMNLGEMSRVLLRVAEKFVLKG